ncbi:uncharacterized protein [Clytia hemisphaerica]|uniref:Uncharacterized protein n=1 Tax=Clytia hemisphaerica TaxID=252671 RepID=A0A7M5V015_9CNID|eukprot:TCONS_00011669-protein
MDRVIDFRRPDSSTKQNVETKLSKTSRIFFTLNIIQVLAVGSIQTTMMLLGDFKGVAEGGMGPGRKVYMALFCFGVLYSCFLCLFAVRNENFLEVVAFVIQNFAYIVYSFVQVYHISYKKYHGLAMKIDKKLGILVIVNCVVLIMLNIIFTYLAHQLFIEYGWKIYKRVRFNVRLRAGYHYYELVICLMKMTLMFVTMFSICLNQTILRDFPTSVNYIISICFIPITLFMCLLAVYGIRKEIKFIMVIFLITLLTGIGLNGYEVYSVGKKTCKYCEAFYANQTTDIPEEVILHVVYLASVALVMFFLLSLATLKVISNFGIGLKSHFEGQQTSSTILAMGFPRGLVRSLFSSSMSKADSISSDLPDITRDNIIINTSSARDSLNSTDSAILGQGDKRRHSSTNSTVSDISIEFNDSENNNKSKLSVPNAGDFVKSNSMPDRLSNEQRPSVIERISKQASNRLHKLYYRTISVESEHDLCGCCFWRKRESVNSFGVSIDVNDDTLSNILSRYRVRSDSTSSGMEFYNPNFLPKSSSQNSDFSTAGFSEQHTSNFKDTFVMRPMGRVQNGGKFRRASEFRNGVSDIVSDVIIEEIEEIPRPVTLVRHGKAKSVETVFNIGTHASSSIQSSSSEMLDILDLVNAERRPSKSKVKPKRKRSKSLSSIKDLYSKR